MKVLFARDSTETMRRWLDLGHSGDLLLVLHWDVLLRGELTEAQALYDRREALVAELSQGGPIANHAARACLLAMRGDARQARQLPGRKTRHRRRPAAVAAGGQPVRHAHDPGGVARSRPAFDAVFGEARRWMAVPLTAGTARPGLLLFASAQPTAYGSGQADISAALVGQTMLAYQNAQLFEQVKLSATVDSLTGIGNRRHLTEFGGRAVAQARERGAPLAAIMIDIDRFTQVNDEHGHQVGDEVIRTIAARLRGHLRDGDVFARYGGEEFAVVLDADDGFAADVYLDAPDTGVEDPLARADARLYEAKRAGRNRAHAQDGVSQAR